MQQSQPISNPRAPALARKPRIALFSGNYNCLPDGANQALNRLVAFLESDGFAVRVYSPVVPYPAFEPAGELVGVRSIPFPGRGEYRVAVGLPAETRRDLDAFAPDIVHVSAPDPLGRAAQRYAADRRIPIVASLHTRFETYFEFYGLGFVRGMIERYLQRFYRRCDLVFAPNRPMAEMLVDDGVDPARIAIWSRGVDRQKFDPARRSLAWRAAHGIADSDLAVLFFGRLVREKGIADFAATLARAALPNVRPVVVGEGPAHGEFARCLPGAVFTGHLSGNALGEAVASADVLLNPSATEAFGNVNLEAMAAGLAVISADAPSGRALIEPGRTGLLVAPGDIDGYAAALTTLADNKAFRTRLGQAAREESARYDWDAASADVAAGYFEVIRPKPAKAAISRRRRQGLSAA
uniref:glycosyltransferase family 4 protein n=1 Tax=Altererythrobacter segetis TaxID=1104773 RepID=UPI00140E6C69|nr:glycosyltransferase family 1 protein [Altererythrobacter segetis]